MNLIYRTIWNAVRGQLVVVNETTTSHAQVGGSTVGSMQKRREKNISQFARSVIATCVASALALPMAAYAVNIDFDYDTSGSVTDWTNSGSEKVNVEATLTNNKQITIQGESFGDEEGKNAVKVDQLIVTTDGAVVGDGRLEANALITNSGQITQGKITLQNHGALTNNSTGTVTVDELVQGASGVISNKGTLNLNAATHNVTAGITNTGTLNAKNLTVAAKVTNSNIINAKTVTLNNELENNALDDKVKIETLNVSGTGSVSGIGKLNVGVLTIADAGTVAQKDVTTTGMLTNDGSITLTGTLDVQGGMSNKKTLTVKNLAVNSSSTNTAAGSLTAETITIAGSKTLTNQGVLDATNANVAGTLSNTSDNASIDNLTVTGALSNRGILAVATKLDLDGTATNTGTLTAKTVDVDGKFTNEKTLNVTTLNLNSGSIEHNDIHAASSVTASGNATLAAGTKVSQKDMSVAGALNAQGTLNLGGTLTGNTADFAATATGTVANAELTGAMTHAGKMNFGNLSSSSDITTTAGTLTIDTLKGAAVVNANGGIFKSGSQSELKDLNVAADGTANLGSTTISGNLTTAGTLTATGALTVQGAYTQNDKTADLTSLSVTNALNLNKGSLTASGNVSAASAKNAGTMNLGTMNVTGTLTNSGELNATGLVTAANLASTATTGSYNGGLTITDTLTVESGVLNAKGTVTAAKVDNKGDMNLATLKTGTSFKNTGTLTTTGSADITNFENTGSGHFSSLTLRGTGKLNGETLASQRITFAEGSNYTSNQDLSSLDIVLYGAANTTGSVKTTEDLAIYSTGHLKAASVDVKGQLTLNGTLEITGSGPSKIDYFYPNVAGGAVLKNAGDLTINRTGAQVTGMTYEQTGGSLTYSGNFFTYSDINLFGGVIDRGSGSLGSGNTFTIKALDGVGEIGSGGSLNPDWESGRSVLSVDLLTDKNTYNLESGGLIKTKSFYFTSSRPSKKLFFKGGALETSLGNFFTNVSSSALDIKAIDTESQRIVIKGGSAGVTSVGAMKSNINKVIDYSGGGDIVFTDKISTDLITVLNNKFAEVNQGGKPITIHYAGHANEIFTIKDTNDLLTLNKGTPNFVLDTTTLYANNGSEQVGSKKAITVGGEAGDYNVNGTIGFQRVMDSDSITVKNGEFALVGSVSDEVALIGGTMGTSSGNATADGANAQFTYGSNGLSGLKGKVGTLTASNGGSITGKAGTFKVAAITATNGKVDTMAGNVTNVTTVNLDATSTLDNAGSITVSDRLNALAGSTITNTGNLTVKNDVTKTTIAGTLNNTSGLADLKGGLVVTGKVVNGSSAKTVAEGQVRSNGATITTKSLSINPTGNFENNANLLVTGKTVIQGSATGINDNQFALSNVAGAVAQFQGETIIGGTGAVRTLKAGGNNTLVMNKGQMEFATLSLAKGAQLFNFGAQGVLVADTINMDALSSINNGTGSVIQATTFNQKGTLRNNGTISGKVLSVANFSNFAKVEDGQGVLVEETLNVEEGGNFNNAKDGLIDASKADVNIARNARGMNRGMFRARGFALARNANFSNVGTFSASEYNLEAGSSFENSGSLIYDNATIAGNFVNQTSGSVDIGDKDNITVGGNLTVKGEGTYLNKGKTTVLNSVILQDQGTVTHANGNFSADAFEFKGGTFNIKGETEKAHAAVMLKGEFNGNLTVENGSLKLGMWGDPIAPEKRDLTVSTANATLIAEGSPIKLGANGKLAVGTGASEQLSSMNGGDAWFGNDSLFVVDTSKMTSLAGGGSAALVGNEGSNLTIQEGAKLQLNNVGWGSYFLTQNFAGSSEETWETTVTDANGQSENVTIKKDENGNVILQVGSGDIRDKASDIGIYNIVNTVIQNPTIRNVNGTGVIGFLSKSIEDSILAKKDQSAVINAVSNIGAAGGLYAQNFMLTENLMNHVDEHLAYGNASVDQQNAQPWNGVRAWVDMLGQKVETSDLAYTGGNASFDADNTGLVFGLDLMSDSGLRYGAAFAAQKGDLDSKDSLVKTTNKSDAYSFVGYAAKNVYGVPLVASIGYTNSQSELAQTLPGTLGSHNLDVENHIFTIGLRAEKRIDTESGFSFVPHAGVRSVTVISSDETSKMGGKAAFKYEADTVEQIQLPLGIAVEKQSALAGGWKVRSLLDLSVTPVIGDKEVNTTVSVDGIQAADKLETTFSDDITGAARLAISAEKRDWSVGAEVGYSSGDSREGAVTFGLNARYNF